MRDDILRMREAAERLDVTDRTLHRLAPQRRSSAVEVGAAGRLGGAGIDPWCEDQKSDTARRGGVGEEG